MNQLAFGANPGANAGGPGGACGKCVEITPVNKAGAPLTENALTFMLVDMCPVDSSGGSNCNQCNTQEANVFGHAFHFDIATDAMNKSQYQKFFEGVTDGLYAYPLLTAPCTEFMMLWRLTLVQELERGQVQHG